MKSDSLANRADKDNLIYFLDDDLIYLKVVSHDLQKQGYRNVRSFSTAKDIIEAVKEKQPDITLLDYHLGGKKTGLDVLKKVKEISPESANIFLTASDDINVAIATMKNGAYDYVIKGDTALIRINHLLGNICSHRRAEKKNQAVLWYKVSIVFLIIVFAALLSYITYLPVE
jgi:two-component system OmpR family response regulator